MAFKDGDAKPEGSGRQRGTPNKRTQDLINLAHELDADPFTFLAKVMKGDLRDFGYAYPDEAIYNPEEHLDGENLSFDKTMGAMLPQHMIPLETRIEAAKELMPYLHAKRKAVEIKVEDDSKGKVFTLAYAVEAKKEDGGP